MRNQNESVVIDIIAPTVRRHIQGSFKIYENHWGITVRWGSRGILFSCPRDMDPNKYLCEVSLVLKDGSLTGYFRGNRHRLQYVYEIIHTIYEAYYYYEIIHRIRMQAFRFQFQYAIKQLQQKRSLLGRCLYQIGTAEMHFLRSLMW